MKLWLLRPNEDWPGFDNPWDPWHGKVFGFVVRAETECQARQYADVHAGDENSEFQNIKHPWLESKYTTCIELLVDGEVGIILSDYQTP